MKTMQEKKHCKWYNDEICTNDKSPCVADYCPVVEYPELCKHSGFDKDINVRSEDDEGILQKVEYCISRDGFCDGCKYSTETYKASNCVILHDSENLFNLIHRLQGENAGLQKQIEMQRKIIEYQDSVEDKNAELQKQVDELKEERENMQAEIIATEESRLQAVKDTAKEILQEVGNIVDDGDDRFKYKDYQWHKDLCKRYGVEVE